MASTWRINVRVMIVVRFTDQFPTRTLFIAHSSSLIAEFSRHLQLPSAFCGPYRRDYSPAATLCSASPSVLVVVQSAPAAGGPREFEDARLLTHK